MSDTHPLLERAQALHQDIVSSCRESRRARHRLMGQLRQMEAEELHQALGYATVAQYAAAALDLPPRETRDLLRVARALPSLEHLDRALASGDLGWTKARELVRVMTPENEEAWLARAREVSSRDLEVQVACSVAGDPPPADGESRGPARVKIVIEVEAADAQIVRQGLALLRATTRTSDAEIDDGAALTAIMRRFVAEGAEREAMSDEPYRVVLEHCPSCARTVGLEDEVSDTVVSEACCDAEIVDMQPGPKRGHASRVIPPATRRQVLHDHRWTCAVPNCRNRLWLHVHHLHPWAKGGGNEPSNLVPLCSVHHRLVHDGMLAVERDAEGRLVVEHADGRRFVGFLQVGNVEMPRRHRPSGLVRVKPGRPKRRARGSETESSGGAPGAGAG